MKLKPEYAENIVVYIIYNNIGNWYVTDKDYWFMDRIKIVKKNNKSVITIDLEVSKHSEKGDVEMLDSDTACKFLECINELKTEPAELLKLMNDRLEEMKFFEEMVKAGEDGSEYFDDILDYCPVLYVDFDNKIFLSQYPEMISFENYVPEGWTADYKSFIEYIPEDVKYWLDNGLDLFKESAKIHINDYM